MSLSLEGKQIFIIEDDVENLAVISTILRREGAKISYDRWGHKTAKRITRIGHIDVILCDLMLPGDASGYDVLKQIRAEDTLKDVPVIVVTASDPDVELEKARQAGFSGYISKPLHRRRFHLQVLAIIEGKEVWADDPQWL